MPRPERLGLLVCECLHPAAVELVRAARLEDVRLIPFPGDCSRQLDGWQEIERAVATLGDCQQFRMLAGACVPGPAPAILAGRQLPIVRCFDGLPRALSDAGRERLGLLIEKTALEWRLECQRTRLNVILSGAYRRLTDFGMVTELVSGLAGTLAEEKVVDRVFGLFAAMLAPTTMVFAALEEGKLLRIWSRPAGFGESEEVKRRLVAFSRSHAWTESGAGFRLSLRHRTRTLGVLEVEGASFSEYRDHYLDLALVVARTGALAIADARLYREMKGPNRSYLGFAEDLQDALAARKRAEEKQAQLMKQVEAANLELAAFAHTVAHDLKSPLGAVLGFAELLTDAAVELSSKDVRESLQAVHHSARKMNNIIDELLLLAEVREAEVEKQPVEMAAIVSGALQRLSHMTAEYAPEIVLPDRWPLALAHGPWIEEVWANYLSNAMKYGGRPPRLELGADTADGKARFWVRDNGPGLTPEQQARLFMPFTRLHHARATGSGLGLSIVRRIMEKLGGEAWVESESGRSSRFGFTLPHVPASD
ncbi:HAMP domain-containing histidine kinase [candidate division WOR-3 bacterium]|uniref:histidine kinase n=1 Tax=candidate division WOR-3 bacterium TaxID=2052148 RepID=A0A937XF21_UNCW3|nr:HAMP domain-containing histidine kinase [candidate division WOR-3 bacterium]